MIFFFSNFQIEADDGLPQNVCKKCVSDIRVAFAYRQKCEQSDAELREMFQRNKSHGSVKLERNDDEHPTDERWFDEPENIIISEIDLKTEDAQSCTEHYESTTFQIDFDANSAHSFDASLSPNELDIFDETHDEHNKTDSNLEKKYACEVCAKVFNRKYNWKQHKLVHSDVKNFACHICGQEYKSQNNLK